MTDPGRPQPPVTETTAPFWDATRQQRLLLQWCTDCDQPVFFPREVCPRCLGSSLAWRPAEGTGTVHTFTVEHRPQPAFGTDPYVIALVDLTEGVRIMSNVVHCPPASVRVGQAVRVCWEPLEDGRHLPQFEPDGDQGP